MKKTLIGLALLMAVTGHAQEQSNKGINNEYKLVWSDEFDKDGIPNPAKWTYEIGFTRNKELQWYQPDNAYVKNGLLIIEGKREKKPNPNYDPQSTDWKTNREFAEYTSSCVKTLGLHEWLYGRFEIKAKIPAVKGSWPAIWFLGYKPRAGQWPLCGEIDLMEYYRVDDVATLHANACWGPWDSAKWPISHFLEKDKEWENKFHVWRMDWDKDFIRLYIDDELLNEIDLSETITREGVNPFHHPQNLLLNLAIGRPGEDPSKTEFPIFFEIDYVRVYQK
ncbi:family 16 glycosylhydrolase [Bacteroides sp. 519]|uniref:glycoside hydrolase family 16 protein n=1 Tax=Bacteroides sp. 519 TaxID=2302937 RepID=UPI0013D5EF80|nr:glycoside hydrolase family 16 protein [Bacteroides sp. 519]NDV58353.1 glycoside hydrolase family 16 protein [Bacteroides sp. 519]